MVQFGCLLFKSLLPSTRSWLHPSCSFAIPRFTAHQRRLSSTTPTGFQNATFITGQRLHLPLDLSQAFIGQSIDVPYQVTLADARQTVWQATFATHDRLYNSTPFAQLLNLNAHLLPFSLLLFYTISMSHIDESRQVLDLSYDFAVYHRPVYANDTVHQVFTIKHLRNTSDQQNTIVTVGCELFNSRNQLCFSVDKLMLYPKVSNPYRHSVAAQKTKEFMDTFHTRSHLLAHILYHADSLPVNHVSLAMLLPHQLQLHSVQRPIGAETSMQISTLFRWTHPSIYQREGAVVPGGLVVAATLAATSRALFETLLESIVNCSLLHKVAPQDTIGAMTYCRGIRSLKEGALEELDLFTIGVKNMDVCSELKAVPIPMELFTERLKTSQVEELVMRTCPVLRDRIVCVIHRKVVRQSPYSQQRSIPLL